MSSTVIPCLRYRDAPGMIDWLCDTFGFEKQMVIPNEDGTIAHSQLTLGSGMIMVGSVIKTELKWGRQIKQPDEIGRFETQSPYVVVDNVDALYERAKAAGAEILMEITDQDYGSRDFICRDPEGHLWSFGTYDPWPKGPDAALPPLPEGSRTTFIGNIWHCLTASCDVKPAKAGIQSTPDSLRSTRGPPPSA